MSTYEPWRKSDAGACLDRAWQGARVGVETNTRVGGVREQGRLGGRG